MVEVFQKWYVKVILIAVLIIFALVIGYMIGGGPQTTATTAPTTATPTTTLTPSITLQASDTPVPPVGEVKETQLIRTPTLAPTVTPGVVTNFVEKVAENIGVDEFTFIGLSGEDWLNLFFSFVIFLILLLLLSRVIILILKDIVRRSPTKYDDLLLNKVHSQITWLLGVIGLQYGTLRLIFLEPQIKQWLNQIYSSLYVIIFSIMVWKLMDVGIEWYKNEVETKHDEHQKDTILLLGHRIGRFFLIAVSVVMILSINNINVSVLIASLGILGLAFSLAAQDSLSNLISGVLISLDQPFRVGDRIEIQGLGTWGDVVDIGLRSTRIRTRDNTLVIVPNSKIGSDQVINYTFPDPQYRIQMEINIPYGEDIEKTRHIIISSVRKVEGVLPEKPVEALYVAMGGTGMVFRIRWWIDSYIDTRRMFDRVNSALQVAFDAAGIHMPNPAYDINVFEEPKSEE